MSIKIYVPKDSAALALGADEVAAAVVHEAQQLGMAIELVRNGSRGMFWLEPLVEVVTDAGRMAYGPVAVEDVASLFDAQFHKGGVHRLGLGLTEEIDYLRKQERLTFARMGVTDPLSLEDYEAHDGFVGLRHALACLQPMLCKRSWIRACAGEAVRLSRRVSNGEQWLQPPTEQKYIVCNADEGDSGTYLRPYDDGR